MEVYPKLKSCTIIYLSCGGYWSVYIPSFGVRHTQCLYPYFIDQAKLLPYQFQRCCIIKNWWSPVEQYWPSSWASTPSASQVHSIPPVLSGNMETTRPYTLHLASAFSEGDIDGIPLLTLQGAHRRSSQLVSQYSFWSCDILIMEVQVGWGALGVSCPVGWLLLPPFPRSILGIP